MRDGITFIHAADLHLDAPFSGLTACSSRIGTALADATYEAFRRVVDVAIERHVDFVAIAGDAYNCRDKSLRAQLGFREQMIRLAEHGIRVFIVQGNHDPANGWSAGLAMPDNVHVFPADRVGRVELVRDGEVVAAIYGRSFSRRDVTENLAIGYRREANDPVAIGLLHTNVGGNANYDAYAPATLDELRSAGMDYWALGHIHKQEVIAENPWIVYAGSPQGMNPKETGPHGCFLVQMDPSGTVSLEHVETAAVAWAHAEIDASPLVDIDGVRSAILDACDVLSEAENRAVAARFTLTGRSEAHTDLVRPGLLAQLLEDVRADRAAGDPWVWIDRIDNRTSGLLDIETVRGGGDFASEVVRIADELAADEAGLAALIAEISAPVATTLSGYETHLAAGDVLIRARDVLLDDVLSEGR